MGRYFGLSRLRRFKTNRKQSAKTNSRRKRRLLLLSLLFGSLSGGSIYGQMPEGGNITAGVGTIATEGLTTNITTATDRAIIDWNNFSVGQGSTVNFNQPGVDSAVLNRVLSSGTPSLINGAINSNGNVFLVNPSGIVVGSTGVINTNGFVGSTLDISNSKFMEGEDLQFSGDSTAAIINQGTIATGSGGAHLLAHEIHNSGTITSNGGSINLATGGTIQLPNGNSYIQADIQSIANGISETASLIKNSGTVRVTGALRVGGEVYLVNPNGNVVNEGTIAAQLTQSDSQLAGGSVRIDASGGSAEIGGTIDVSGTEGGFVAVSGDSVHLDDAMIDASGTQGGGEVLVGGGHRGGDSRIANAANTFVSADTVIDVSATEAGDAGTAIVWSDVATEFWGTIVGRANGATGNGGFAEVSGSELIFRGLADLSAAAGEFGTLLLDPAIFTVDGASAPALRRQWGLSNLIIEASTRIDVVADLFPTDLSDVPLTTGTPTSLTMRDELGGVNSIDIVVAADITETRTGDDAAVTSSFLANSGTFAIEPGGSVSMKGKTVITAANIDLDGTLSSARGLTFNAFDDITKTYTENVGMGDGATGTFSLSDSDLGNIRSRLTILGGDFDLDFDGAAGFQQRLEIQGEALNIDSYSGSGLKLTGTSLDVNGPITGSTATGSTSTSVADTFEYIGPTFQTIGLGSGAGAVTLDAADLAGITGFSQFIIGNTHTASSALSAVGADLSAFANVVLRGSQISFDNVSIKENLALQTQNLVITNPVTKTNNTGSLEITPLNTSISIGIGDGTSGGFQIRTEELDYLGRYDDLSVSTSFGDLDINVDFQTASQYPNSLSFSTTSGTIYVDNLKTASDHIRLSSSDLVIATDADALHQTFNNAGGGTLELVKPTGGFGATMKIGAGASGNWTLTNAEIDEITGFTDIDFHNQVAGGTISLQDADLTGITAVDGATTFTADNFIVSGTEGLKIDGSLELNIASSFGGTGPIETLSAQPQTLDINVSSSLGIGNGTAGSVNINQSELDRFIGFDKFDFSGQATHVNATFDKDVSIDSGAFNTTITQLTHTVSGKSTDITANNIVGGTITSDGDVNLSATQDIDGAPRLTLNRGDIGGSNADGDVNFESANGDIAVAIINPNDGLVTGVAHDGSMDILTSGTTRFGTLTITDDDNPFSGPSTYETLKVQSSAGDLIFTDSVYADGKLEITAAGKLQTTEDGILETEYAHHDENSNIKLVLSAGDGIEHINGLMESSGLRVAGTQYVEASTSNPDADIWIDATAGGGTLRLGDFSSSGDIAVDADNLIVLDSMSTTGNDNITLRSLNDMTVNADVKANGTGDVNLVAGWDGTTQKLTPFDTETFKDEAYGTTLFGTGTGVVQIGDGTQAANVSVGSRLGETNVFAKDLNITADPINHRSAQLGYRLDATTSATGSIDTYLMGSATLTGGTHPLDYATIGHGDYLGNTDLGKTVGGDIYVRAADQITLNAGTIGHQIDYYGVYASGDTYLAVTEDSLSVGQPRITIGNNSKLISDSRADGGELRLYVPSEERVVIADNANLNGVYGLTFNSADPYPKQTYADLFEGDYIGSASQNWSIFVGIIDIIVRALDGQSIYGDVPVNPGMQLVDGNLVTVDQLSSIGLQTTFAITPTTNAGTYTLSVDDSTLSPKYRLQNSFNGTFIVDKAPLAILSENVLKDFRDTAHFDSTSWRADGLKNGETVGTVEFQSDGAHEDALSGPYLLNVSDASGGTFNPANYDISYHSGNLLVSPNSGYYSHDLFTRAQAMATSLYQLFDKSEATIDVNVPSRSGVSPLIDASNP
ncbi:Heme/hemopexin-binding protein precursor [Rosistilla oblonga]|nr:Heme/hemopexin-binding protein precursor [Rosistilla oblonga]